VGGGSHAEKEEGEGGEISDGPYTRPGSDAKRSERNRNAKKIQGRRAGVRIALRSDGGWLLGIERGLGKDVFFFEEVLIIRGYRKGRGKSLGPGGARQVLGGTTAKVCRWKSGRKGFVQNAEDI